MNNISPTMGTAAIVQAMVSATGTTRSGTGVIFSRNPGTGEKGLYGEYMMQAQGEDLVSGVRTPEPITKLRTVMPEIYSELSAIAERLERHFADMQDIEFTVESGKLLYFTDP